MQDDQDARHEVVAGFRNVHFCVVSKQSVWPTNKAAKVVSLIVRRFDRALVVDDDDLLGLWFQDWIIWPNVSMDNPFVMQILQSVDKAFHNPAGDLGRLVKADRYTGRDDAEAIDCSIGVPHKLGNVATFQFTDFSKNGQFILHIRISVDNFKDEFIS